MKISFIGAGNVAWHLAQAFEDAGHWICEIYSRDPRNAKELSSRLYDSDTQEDLNFSDSPAELIVIAVPDDALEDVIQQVVFPENVMVVNTSGTRSLTDLRNLVSIHSDVYVHTGVFYPVQTFTKTTAVDYKAMPICIESTHEKIEDRLTKLAQSVSDNVQRLDSDERLILHIAAVFANNFVNHLLSVSNDLMAREQLDFDLLKPLIAATVQKALDSDDPADEQTGPAKRGDHAVASRHLAYLQNINTNWADIYRVMNEKIRTHHLPK